MLNLIFLGPPGAGKGTYSARIVGDYKVCHVSTGDMLRAAVKNGTELGKKAAEFMDAGKLVPDEVILGLIGERMKDADTMKGVLLDGFPRTIAQAEGLERIFGQAGRKLNAVIYLSIDDDLVIERLSGRRTCGKCGAGYHVVNIPPREDGVCDKCGGALVQRSDDNPDSIKVRLKGYYEQTTPLIDFYRERGLLFEVHADRLLTPEKAVGLVRSIIDKVK